MKLLSSVLLAALCVALAASQDNPAGAAEVTSVTTAEVPITTDVTTTTTVAPSPTTAVPSSSTTEGPTSSTTAEPTSSTTKAPTSSTTKAPTSSTTEEPTSSTTVEPSSSTTETPTSTSPAPKPDDIWAAKYENGTICMLMKAKISIGSSNFSVTVPQNASTVNSQCNPEKIMLDLIWKDKNGENEGKVQISVNVTESTYFVAAIYVDVGELDVLKSDLKQFETEHGQYYKCNPDSAIDIDKTVKVTFTAMEFEVFSIAVSEAKFTGKYLECAAERSNNVVVVAVGCAMGILVIVILVTYLFVRRRNRQRGYQSV